MLTFFIPYYCYLYHFLLSSLHNYFFFHFLLWFFIYNYCNHFLLSFDVIFMLLFCDQFYFPSVLIFHENITYIVVSYTALQGFPHKHLRYFYLIDSILLKGFFSQQDRNLLIEFSDKCIYFTQCKFSVSCTLLLSHDFSVRAALINSSDFYLSCFVVLGSEWHSTCSRHSRRGLVQEYKRTVFAYTHGLFIT